MSAPPQPSASTAGTGRPASESTPAPAAAGSSPPASLFPAALQIPSHAEDSTAASSTAARLASLYPAPTPPLPETPHPHKHSSEFSPAPIIEADGSPHAFPVVTGPDAQMQMQIQLPSAALPSGSTESAAAAAATAAAVAAARIPWRRKLVLVLVGLPARGKSYIAYKLMGYLRWRGLNANLFNVGKHRRQVAERQTLPQSAEYFSPANEAATHQRDEIAMEVLDCMLDWLGAGGDVSIFDATNTTSARRRAVLARCESRSADLRVIFLESICDDARVLELNYKVKAMNSPDYKDMPLDAALKDLKMRVANYEKIYESIEDDSLSYIKLYNLASKVVSNKIHGAVAHSIAAYLMSIHVQPRPIFFVRAGHSESDRGEIEIEGQQYQDRQILKSDSGASADPAAAPASASAAAHDFHIPYTVAMAANLDSAGRSFAKRLTRFITHKVEDYSQKTLERGRLAAQAKKEEAVAAAAAAHGQYLAPSASSATAALTPPVTPPSPSPFSPPSPAPSPAPPSTVALSAAAAVSAAADTHLPLVVYTSTLPRAIQTAQNLKDRAYTFEPQPSLNMLDTGLCSGMNIDEIRSKMPEEIQKWQKHKFRYRFPGGESQSDRARSLEPLVFELERQTLPVLVVSHMSTLQVLLGFFYGSKRSVDSYYSLWIPQHVVLELIPHQYGWLEIRHDLSEEACADDNWDSAAQSDANSPARSPRRTAVPVELGAEAADEVERFNLQVVAKVDESTQTAKGAVSSSKHRAQAHAKHLAAAATGDGLLKPRFHDRSISIPAHNQLSPSVSGDAPIVPAAASSSSSAAASSSSGALSPPPLHPVSEGGPGEPVRKASAKSIGKSSQVKILGETNFYASEEGQA